MSTAFQRDLLGPPLGLFLIAGHEVILKNAKAGDGMTGEVLKIKLEPRAKYVELAAEYFGLLMERVEMTGDAEFIAILQRARTRAAAAKALAPAKGIVDV